MFCGRGKLPSAAIPCGCRSESSAPAIHAHSHRIGYPARTGPQPGAFHECRQGRKWFRRKCNDVVGRQCTPAEKADVISCLLGTCPYIPTGLVGI
ncbi:MAG: DUF1924 domain-containing protein [Rhodanobacter sp.]|nr:DUF1924 domain-containing protein [Rhodanobacter sp.]